ncbi:MAG: alpha/beta hydrolase family protein, partial [Gemmataceae bacterium]|nr:alpha/beta hydrolase family protein [Gemmataceae bacterium]
NQVAALHVKMAYYGPRRPAKLPLRMLSTDIPHTLAAVRQTVLDLRRAVAWLETRPEIDGSKLGICGTSLGSFLAALTAESEPKLSKVALLYGGGGFVEGYRDHPRAKPLVIALQILGIPLDVLKQALAPVDPLTCADNLKSRDVLIVAAKRDDIVPPRMAELMWEACGKPKIVWFDTTHYGAVFHAVSTLRYVLEHFRWN